MCPAITPDEVKCMTDAGSKSGSDIQAHCQGVDLDRLSKQEVILHNRKKGIFYESIFVTQVKESKICSHMECIGELEKDIYTPCKRSDVGMCLRMCKIIIHIIYPCL